MSRHAESTLQSHCVAWFRWQYPALRWVLFAIPNGAYIQGDSRQRAMRWSFLEREGASKGTADLFLSVSRRGYNGLFIEMKTPAGRQSADQKEFQKAVEANCYLYAMPRTLKEFQAIVNEYLNQT
jgi:hypothetical protein